MYKIPIMCVAIIVLIIISIIVFITDELGVVIDKQKKKVDLASIEQEAIYLYLIKQKYISRSRDNSYFYSSVLQFAQSGSTMCSNENFFKSLALIISIPLSVLAIILGENIDMQIKIASISIAIAVSVFILILFYFLRLKKNNRSLRCQDLHSLMLSIQLEDSIKRKI